MRRVLEGVSEIIIAPLSTGETSQPLSDEANSALESGAGALPQRPAAWSHEPVAVRPVSRVDDDGWTKVTKENPLPHDLPPGSEVLRCHRVWERTGYGYMTQCGYVHDSDVTHFRRASGSEDGNS